MADTSTQILEIEWDLSPQPSVCTHLCRGYS